MDLLPKDLWEMNFQEFCFLLEAKSKIKKEEIELKIKDDQKNSILSGYYSALFSRQKRIAFPIEMINEIYATEKEKHQVTLEEIQRSAARVRQMLGEEDSVQCQTPEQKPQNE